MISTISSTGLAAVVSAAGSATAVFDVSGMKESVRRGSQGLRLTIIVDALRMARAARAKQVAAAGGEGVSRALAQEILQWLAREQRQIVATIKNIVEMESPSHAKPAI